MPRHALLTVGATAPFPALITALTQSSVLRALSDRGFTHLHIQTGVSSEKEPAWLRKMRDRVCAAEDELGLKIDVFAHKPSLKNDMLLCLNGSRDGSDDKALDGESGPKGLVLTHAGTGSVLEAWRLGVPFIAYANPGLMDNHQAELAEEMERYGVGVRGDLSDPLTDLTKLDALVLRLSTTQPSSTQNPPRPVLWDIAARAMDVDVSGG